MLDLEAIRKRNEERKAKHPENMYDAGAECDAWLDGGSCCLDEASSDIDALIAEVMTLRQLITARKDHEDSAREEFSIQHDEKSGGCFTLNGLHSCSSDASSISSRESPDSLPISGNKNSQRGKRGAQSMSTSQTSIRERLIRDLPRNEEFRYDFDEEFVDSYISAQLRALREDRKLTQTEVAKRAKTGQSQISEMESDYHSWSLRYWRVHKPHDYGNLRIRKGSEAVICRYHFGQPSNGCRTLLS